MARKSIRKRFRYRVVHSHGAILRFQPTVGSQGSLTIFRHKDMLVAKLILGAYHVNALFHHAIAVEATMPVPP